MHLFILATFCLLFYAARSQDSLYTRFDEPSTPTVYSTDGPAEIGMVFKSAKNGTVSAIRYYTSTEGTYNATLWDENRKKVDSVSFTSTGRGWNRVDMRRTLFVDSGKEYTASIMAPKNYDSRSQALKTPIARGNLAGIKGTYAKIPGTFPTAVYDNVSYYITPVFQQASTTLIKPIFTDTVLKYPSDSIQLGAFISGTGVSWQWSILTDTLINDQLTIAKRFVSTQFNPWVKPPLQENTYVITVTDHWGNSVEGQAHVTVVKPIALLLSDGTWIPAEKIMVLPPD